MGLFNRNRRREINSVIAHDQKVEIVAHKNAARETVEQVNQANETLQKLFEDNHFHIKIFVGVGGKAPQNKKR